MKKWVVLLLIFTLNGCFYTKSYTEYNEQLYYTGGYYMNNPNYYNGPYYPPVYNAPPPQVFFRYEVFRDETLYPTINYYDYRDCNDCKRPRHNKHRKKR